MRLKTILIILFTVIITIFLMINTEAVEFNLIFGKMEVSKLIVIGVCTVIGFVVGYLAGRPRTVVTSYDDEQKHNSTQATNTAALSDEDRDYIS
jgi:putative membrane protein